MKKFALLKVFSIAFVLIAICTLSPQKLQAEDSPKKVCKEINKQKGKIEKEKSQVMLDRQAIRGQLEEAKASFDLQKSDLLKMSNCSKGNPNNTPQCNELLTKIRVSSENISNFEKLISEKNNKKWALDNSIKSKELDLTNKQCEKYIK